MEARVKCEGGRPDRPDQKRWVLSVQRVDGSRQERGWDGQTLPIPQRSWARRWDTPTGTEYRLVVFFASGLVLLRASYECPDAPDSDWQGEAFLHIGGYPADAIPWPPGAREDALTSAFGLQSKAELWAPPFSMAKGRAANGVWVFLGSPDPEANMPTWRSFAPEALADSHLR